jgi:Concanavalin A-like lectin/glucanases superfamily
MFWLPDRMAKPDAGFELNYESAQAVGLAHAWPLVGGGLVAHDLADGADGTLQNMELDDWSSDEERDGLQFGGTDEYVDCGSRATSDGAEQYTQTAWIYRTATSQIPALGHGTASNPSRSFCRGSENSNFYFWTGTTSAYCSISSSAAAFPVNQWVHLALVYDGTQPVANDRMKLWANAVPTALSYSGTLPTTAGSVNGSMFIGRSYVFAYEYSTARMADVRWYTRALSEAEIRALWSPETRWELYQPPRRRSRAISSGALVTLPNSDAWLRALVNTNATFLAANHGRIDERDVLMVDLSASGGTNFAANQTAYDTELSWLTNNRAGIRVGRYISSHYATLQNDLETGDLQYYYPHRAAWRDALDTAGLSPANRVSTPPADTTSDYYGPEYDGTSIDLATDPALGIAVNFKKATAKAAILNAIEARLAAFPGPRVAYLDNVATYAQATNKFHTDAEITSYLTELTARCHAQDHRAIANITPKWGEESLSAAAAYAASVDGCTLENAIEAVNTETEALNAIGYIEKWLMAGKLVVLLQPGSDFNVFATNPALAIERARALAAFCMCLRNPGDKLFTAWPYWAGTQPYDWFSWPTVLGAASGAYTWVTATTLRRQFAGGRLTVGLATKTVEWVQIITPPVITVATSVIPPAVNEMAVTYHFPIAVELFGPTTTIAGLTKLLHTVNGATATIVHAEAIITVQATGGDRTINVDIQKSTGGGAFATIMSATIAITNATTIRVPVSGTFSNTSLVDGDILQAVVTVAGSAGAQAQGLLLNLWLREG